jgi:hypothetical protein
MRYFSNICLRNSKLKYFPYISESLKKTFFAKFGFSFSYRRVRIPTSLLFYKISLDPWPFLLSFCSPTFCLFLSSFFSFFSQFLLLIYYLICHLYCLRTNTCFSSLFHYFFYTYFSFYFHTLFLFFFSYVLSNSLV